MGKSKFWSNEVIYIKKILKNVIVKCYYLSLFNVIIKNVIL